MDEKAKIHLNYVLITAAILLILDLVTGIRNGSWLMWPPYYVASDIVATLIPAAVVYWLQRVLVRRWKFGMVVASMTISNMILEELFIWQLGDWFG